MVFGCWENNLYKLSSRDLATGLGYAGLIPFITLSVSCWLVPAPFLELMQDGFIYYALGIVCFLAGTVWGSAASLPVSERPTRLLSSNCLTVFSVCCVWIADHAIASLCLMLSYALSVCLEFTRGFSDGWYMRLRARLTVGVLISHAIFLGSLSYRSAL